MKNKLLTVFLLLFSITSCDQNPNTNAALEDIKTLPAGKYVLDRTHANITLRVDHLWFSKYNLNFKRFDAELQLDPKNPKEASIRAVIDANSIETGFFTSQVSFENNFVDASEEGKARNKSIATNAHMKEDFNATIAGEKWLDAKKFPQITFTSNEVKMTSKTTATVVGELSLHGVTKPVALDVRFNGGYAENPYDPFGSRIGFSARGKIKRSDFGIAYGIPEKDSRMGVSDEVEISIETEFVRPKQN